jgi:hypothetical protein
MSGAKAYAEGTYRFVVCVDVLGDDLADAYANLHKTMTRAERGGDDVDGWESTDEAFDPFGNTLPETFVQRTRATVVPTLLDENGCARGGDARD